MAEADLIALIMAGGSGTRFWPASQKALPKQFLTLVGEKSLIAQTADRVRPLVAAGRVYVVATRAQEALLEEHLPDAHRILEPAGKNTAPCLMLALDSLLKAGHGPDEVMAVLPADHFIADEASFRAAIEEAAMIARRTKGLVTLGIIPDSAHTGYGYIESSLSRAAGSDRAFSVTRFIEKPDRARAEHFLAQKNFFWNAGIFVWTLGALAEAFRLHLTESWEAMQACRTDSDRTALYDSLAPRPIDTAVLERASNLFVVPVTMGWSDIGSWNAVYELRAAREKGEDPNVIVSGNVKAHLSHGCLVQVPEAKRIALIGVSDLIVVEKDGVLLIAHRSHDQSVREAAKHFES